MVLAAFLSVESFAQPSTSQPSTRANFTGQELYELTSRFLDALMYPEDIDQVSGTCKAVLAAAL